MSTHSLTNTSLNHRQTQDTGQTNARRIEMYFSRLWRGTWQPFKFLGEEYTWTLVDRQSHIYKCTLVRHETKQQTKARHWARVKMYHASHRQDPGTLLSSLGGRGRIILGWDLDFDRIMGGQRQTLSRQTHGCNFLKDSSVFVCLFVGFVCLFVAFLCV